MKNVSSIAIIPHTVLHECQTNNKLTKSLFLELRSVAQIYYGSNPIHQMVKYMCKVETHPIWFEIDIILIAYFLLPTAQYFLPLASCLSSWRGCCAPCPSWLSSWKAWHTLLARSSSPSCCCWFCSMSLPQQGGSIIYNSNNICFSLLVFWIFTWKQKYC